MAADRVKCTVVVKGNRPFIAIEPVTGGGLVSFYLKEGTTIELAEVVAKLMRQHIESVAITR